jgi:hypothetical protein
MATFRLPTPPPHYSSDDEEEEYTPLTPWIQEVEHSYQNPVSYEPIFRVGDVTKFGASFELPSMRIDATAAAMAEIFLPDRLLDHWVNVLTPMLQLISLLTGGGKYHGRMFFDFLQQYSTWAL